MSYKNLINLSIIACWTVCIGDFAVTFILGALYPGYDFTQMSMSMLGTNASPVAFYMTLWGFVFSALFILFAIGLRKAFPEQIKEIKIAFWLIVIYGLGEGLGSGLFPYNQIGTQLTMSAKLHSLFGALGVLALMAIPLEMLSFFRKTHHTSLYKFSIAVTVIGVIMLILFSISKLAIAQNTALAYRGLWQRLLLLNYYTYLLTLSYQCHDLRKRINHP